MADPSVQRFQRILEAAYAYLEARRQEVNDLNVFPVADGDTGDNMALTMRSVLDELDRLDGGDVVDRSAIVYAVARAALMGARGNSGVILSQIVRGAAEELSTRPGELVDPVLIAAAFARAADAAYDSVRDPAEGTMLTVARAMAHSATQQLARLETERQRLGPGASEAEQDELLAEVLEEVTRAGAEAVEKTTSQLDALAEAGVVDAGAHGLVLILAGVVAGLRHQSRPPVEVAEQAPARLTVPEHSDSRFRYCVNFIVTGSGLDADAFVPQLERLGDSVLVVGDDQTLKVHVHTDEPPEARALFDGVGTVQQVDEADMRAQIEAREERLAGLSSCGVLAVASGEGLRELFEGLGADVVDGGPTMNPSTDELLAGIHAVAADSVLVLPNSPNVVMAAERAVALSDRDARVLPCASQQAGLIALVEFDPSAALAANAERLARAIDGIRIGAIAGAARDDANGRFVRGDAIGFVDGEVHAWGGAGSTLRATLAALSDDAEIVTVIEGAGAPIPLEELAALAPNGVEVETHMGGQPHYWWLLAAQ